MPQIWFSIGRTSQIFLQTKFVLILMSNRSLIVFFSPCNLRECYELCFFVYYFVLKKFYLVIIFLVISIHLKISQRKQLKSNLQGEQIHSFKVDMKFPIKRQIHHKSLASWRYFKLSFGSKDEKAKLFAWRKVSIEFPSRRTARAAWAKYLRDILYT